MTTTTLSSRNTVCLTSSEQQILLTIMQFFAETFDPHLRDQDHVKDNMHEWEEIAEDMGFDDFNALFEKILYHQQ